MRQLETVSNILEAIGGTLAASKLTGASPTAVSNWRRTERLPAKFYLVFAKRLRELHCAAPASCWGIIDPDA
jgi:hypothetical protein